MQQPANIIPSFFAKNPGLKKVADGLPNETGQLLTTNQQLSKDPASGKRIV
ncbi:MAG TPA: hypothetical protein PKC69_00125 [Chitinophagaceae bacterium]|nr:hypothetical protein [Chitinophagaceae bacterium]